MSDDFDRATVLAYQALLIETISTLRFKGLLTAAETAATYDRALLSLEELQGSPKMPSTVVELARGILTDIIRPAY